MSQELKTQTLQFFNDTKKDMTVRINIAGVPPTAKTVKPQAGLLINMRSDVILVKLWDYDTIMFQDRGKKLP